MMRKSNILLSIIVLSVCVLFACGQAEKESKSDNTPTETSEVEQEAVNQEEETVEQENTNSKEESTKQETSAGNQDTTSTSNSLGAFSTDEVRGELTVPEFDTGGQPTEKADFISANFMTFQIDSIEEFLSDWITAEIVATNKGSDTITDISAYVSILDISGIERGTGEVACVYAAEAQKEVSLSGILDVNKKSANKIEVTAYDYTLQGERYHIDLINEEAVKWNANVGTSDFEEKNIMAFSFEAIGVKNDSYGYIINIQNNSDKNITVVECRVIFLDSNNNQLYETNTYISDLKANSTNMKQNYIYPGKTDFSRISKIGVALYSYWFDEEDADGYKGYRINLIDVTATGLTN